MTKREESLQIAIAAYIKLQYPDVIFTSESSGLRLTIGQAVKAKKLRSDGKLPDMIILEPNYKYRGLILELKKEGERVIKKNGEYATPHIKEQAKILHRLRDKGYFAEFGVGFDDTRRMIDAYMEIGKV